MGIKELWPILTPYCERKPISILQGKVVAIDLAGWVCESLNTVDYFIHPRQYMKNLFFRTCYMLLLGIVPVFILEGKAPKLKEKIIQQRNEIQFRGVKPQKKNEKLPKNGVDHINNNGEFKGRTRFNYILKNCETLLNCMGVTCLQAPGEAEAYCSLLNKNGFVDGIISQDSDCFAYGAITVYRNFAVSTQGTSSAQGGSVDIYDMRIISKEIDFGQEKIIVLALFCGCDYANGITGIGKDSVLKLFKKYKNYEILNKIKLWRGNYSKYSELEMKVNNKNVCSNCGHFGKTISHSKRGCSICNLSKGCLETKWKEEKQIIKAELILRQKALQDINFPSSEIIHEFLNECSLPPNLNLTWNKPNIIKFIKNVGKLLQWTEIYCLKKFLPILTRWQLVKLKNNEIREEILLPDFIMKKRVSKGNKCFEIVWKDEKNLFKNLIPDEQMQSYCIENPKGIQTLWTTIEPADIVEKVYSELVSNFMKSKDKPKQKKINKRCRNKDNEAQKDSLDITPLIEATEKISLKVKKSRKTRKGLQLIDKFFYKNNTPMKSVNNTQIAQCSTPKQKLTLLDLENELSYEENNLSDIVNDIILNENYKLFSLANYHNKILLYESTNKDSFNRSKDDLYLLPNKLKKRSNSLENSTMSSFSNNISMVKQLSRKSFCEDQTDSLNEISYFFEKIDSNIEADAFERSFVLPIL